MRTLLAALVVVPTLFAQTDPLTQQRLSNVETRLTALEKKFDRKLDALMAAVDSLNAVPRVTRPDQVVQQDADGWVPLPDGTFERPARAQVQVQPGAVRGVTANIPFTAPVTIIPPDPLLFKAELRQVQPAAQLPAPPPRMEAAPLFRETYLTPPTPAPIAVGPSFGSRASIETVRTPMYVLPAGQVGGIEACAGGQCGSASIRAYNPPRGTMVVKTSGGGGRSRAVVRNGPGFFGGPGLFGAAFGGCQNGRCAR